jgi:predicted DNA-binding transcriptional regulator
MGQAQRELVLYRNLVQLRQILEAAYRCGILSRNERPRVTMVRAVWRKLVREGWAVWIMRRQIVPALGYARLDAPVGGFTSTA